MICKKLLNIAFASTIFLNLAQAQTKIENLEKVTDPKLLMTDLKVAEAWKTTNICIPTFQLNFVTKSDLQVSKLATPVTPTTQSNVYKIAGIKDNTYQQITEEIYQYYVTQLISLGYNIIHREQFEQNDTYKRMVLVEQTGLEYKIKGTPIETVAKLNGSMFARSFTAGHNPSLQFINSPLNTPKITKMLKDLNTNLLDFNVTIDFIEFITQRGVTNKWDIINTTGAPTTVNLDAKPNLHVANFSSNFLTPSMQVVNFNSKAAGGLDRKFIKQTKLITTHPDMDADFGKASKVYEINVDEQIFKQATVDMMKKYIDMMIARLKQEHK